MSRIRSIHIGKTQPFGSGGRTSAIVKQPMNGPVNVTRLGFDGDEQADKKHHGGPEMAVHHYPFEHYEAWIRDFPERADSFATAGAFGENISTVGMTEKTVCVGDKYRVGGAVLEISQGRQPCWKLNVRLGIKQMAVMVQKTGNLYLPPHFEISTQIPCQSGHLSF